MSLHVLQIPSRKLYLTVDSLLLRSQPIVSMDLLGLKSVSFLACLSHHQQQPSGVL